MQPHLQLSGSLPPQAPEIERALLGTVMTSPDAFSDAQELITGDCFYEDRHRVIFQSMANLAAKSRPIDSLSVCEELGDDLERVGGRFYVTNLTTNSVSGAHTVHYCRILIEKFTKRELIRAGAEMVKTGYGSEDAFELLDTAEKSLMGIRSLSTKRNYKPIDAILVDTIRHLESIRHSDKKLTGIPTGFRELDMVTCGWQPTDLIILAARPSVGKTAFALNLARNAAQEVPVGLFSLEMGDRQLIQRLLSSESGIYMWNIRNGKIDNEQMKNLYETGIKPLAKSKIFIDDTASIRLSELRAKARRMVNKDGVQIIFVDYLQLMRADERESRKDLEIGQISAGLKAMAKELNIPVVALSQLSRDVEKRAGEPKLSDLRESGAIEQDADLVMFLWKPSEAEIAENAELSKVCNVKIEKNRNGTLETFLGTFIKETQKWTDLKVLDKNTFLPVGGSWRPTVDYQGANPF
jgi:replicative DNA helicase